MKSTDYFGLLNDLKAEFLAFESNRERIVSAQGRLAQDPEDILLWYSYGYLIHNLYNGFEAYFYRVSQFYENGLPKENWHKVLVDRMAFQVEGTRPAVIKEQDREVFQELRAFRHLIRHLYDRGLDPVRVRLIEAFVNQSLERFPQIHFEFCEAIQTMARMAT